MAISTDRAVGWSFDCAEDPSPFPRAKVEEIEPLILLIVRPNLGVSTPKYQHVGDQHSCMAYARRRNVSTGLDQGCRDAALRHSASWRGLSTTGGRRLNHFVDVDDVKVILDTFPNQSTEQVDLSSRTGVCIRRKPVSGKGRRAERAWRRLSAGVEEFRRVEGEHALRPRIHDL